MMHLLQFAWTDLLNPEFYIVNGGLWLFLFIVFAERRDFSLASSCLATRCCSSPVSTAMSWPGSWSI